MTGRRPSAARGTCNQGPGSGSPNLFFDLKGNVFFKRDDKNIAYEVTKTQVPMLEGLAVADIFMSQNHIREPHWHPNANELDLVVKGEFVFSILDPGVPQLLTYHVGPGQSVFIPQGWWHWFTATGPEENHIVVIFNNELPASAEGSDALRLTPPEVFALAYGVDADEMADVLEPIDQTVVIGPVSSNDDDDRESHDDGAGRAPDRDQGKSRPKGKGWR